MYVGKTLFAQIMDFCLGPLSIASSNVIRVTIASVL